MPLKIQVLGKGMIPRGYGLAPRKEPFPADYLLIGTIISTPGLKVNYLNPATGKLMPLTGHNIKRIYGMYASENYKPQKEEEVVVQTAPVVPDTKKEEVKQEEKREEPPVEEKVETPEEKKEEESVEGKVEDVKETEPLKTDTPPSTGTMPVFGHISGPTDSRVDTYDPASVPGEATSSSTGVLRPQFSNGKGKHNKHK